MEFLILACAILMVAISFPHWELTGRLDSGLVGRKPLLTLTGVVGHLGGSIAIAWTSGIGAGIVAFLAIPIAASVAYSLLINPLTKSRRGSVPNLGHRVRS